MASLMELDKVTSSCPRSGDSDYRRRRACGALVRARPKAPLLSKFHVGGSR
jgi:hypothetical protein